MLTGTLLLGATVGAIAGLLVSASPVAAQIRRGTSALRPLRQRLRARLTTDRGEGVISMAIAVLIIAALGALIWIGFRALWTDAEQQIRQEVNQIGG